MVQYRCDKIEYRHLIRKFFKGAAIAYIIMKKYFIYYERVLDRFIYTILILLVIPLLTFLEELLIRDGNVQQSLQETAKWSLILLPAIIFLMLCYAFFRSDMVEFRDDAIYIYRFITSKKTKKISYDEITGCVVSNGLWTPGDIYVHRKRRIYLFYGSDSMIKIDMNCKIFVELYLRFGDERFKVVGDNSHLKTINKFYDIDFKSLSYEQKLVLAKHYCNPMKANEVSGRRLLEKKHLL